jgi:cytidylate kinase
MSIIIISSDSSLLEKEIAQSISEKLGYQIINREILEKVADKHRIPKEKLIQTLNDFPSFFSVSSRLWNRCIAYIQEATLTELIKDNNVCYGLAAHLYVLGVSHVLRVRILGDSERLVRQVVSNKRIPHEKANELLIQRKKNFRRWSMKAFGIDETDPSQYDLVISLDKIDQDEAVKIIKETISYPRFRPMTYSIKCIDDLELAGRVRAALVERIPDVRVRVNNGTAVIETIALKREKQKRSNLIREIAGKIPGVEYVEVHVINDLLRQAVASFR